MPFCYSPWTNIDIDPQGTMAPCCKFQKQYYDQQFNIYPVKHLRKFNEELVSRFPSHKKGEVVVFANRNADIGYDTVKDLARKLGYEVTGEIYDNGYIVKTKPGEEESAGAVFVENYPEWIVYQQL